MQSGAIKQRPELKLPATEEECVAISNLFISSVAETLAALVRRDGFVTLAEYHALSLTADTIASYSDNPLLVRVLVLRGLFSNRPYEQALKGLKAAAKIQSADVKNAIFLSFAPLLHCSGDHAKEIACDLASALGSSDEFRNQIVGTLPLGKETSVFEKLRFWQRKSEDDLQRAARLADIFGDQELKRIAQELSDGWPSDEAKRHLQEAMNAASVRILANVTATMPSLEELERQEYIARRFFTFSEALVQQIRQRLVSILDRLTFQHEMFVDDFNAFMEASLDEVEVGMRSLLDGREDWIDRGIWERFGKTDAARRIQNRYESLRKRYDRLFDLWQRELNSFSNELKQSTAAVCATIDPAMFASLVKTNHRAAQVCCNVDKAATATLTIAGLGVAGTSLLIVTGVTTLATVGAMAMTPIGWLAGATIVGSIVWKFFSNPSGRKRELIQDKCEAFAKGLRELLGEPESKHREALDNIGKQFFEAASTYYAPLVREARLAVIQAQYETRVVQRITDDVMKALSN